jgi:putative transposase
LDNALMESTIGLYKTELIDQTPRTWSGVAEVERETAGWIQWFNSTRLHSSIGHVPPIEYEQNYRVNTTTPTGEVA